MEMKEHPRQKVEYASAASTSQVGRKRNLLLHPLTLFVSVWALSLLMYALHLSDLLTFTTSQVSRIVQWIVIPYVAAFLVFQTFYSLSPKKIVTAAQQRAPEREFLTLVEAKIHRWFLCWCVLTFVEVVFSGGLPILWLIRGSSKDYSTFGLPVLHVVLSSLLAVLALSEFGIYALHGGKRRLLIPAWLLLWSIMSVSRGIMIVGLLQWSVLWFFLKGTHVRTILKVGAVGLLIVYIFGYLGDLRSGGEAFRALAQPSWNYPAWLPSGFLWFYIYFTTPLGNLVNTSLRTAPLNSFLFPNTLYYAFPTVIRNVIYGKAASGTGGDLVSESFNVSTAYVGPFSDYGYVGMVCFSTTLAIIAAYYWRKRSTFRDGLIYTIVAQCLVLSIFWNFLFYMPFLGQVFWVYFLFRRPTVSAKNGPVSVLVPPPA